MNTEYQNEDFQHGFQSGAENVGKETYEGYLSNQVSYEWLQEKIVEKKEEIRALENEIETTRNAKRSLFASLKEHESKAEVLELQMSRLNHKNNEWGQKLQFIEQRKTIHHTPYALLAGILYLLAGTAFISGDLIISHEIVAYALNIKNSVEAWAFAIGLASLSVLLKPAYERLVEQPYLTNFNEKTKRVYGFFQGVLLVFALGTMIVLGWFRYEAYKTDRLKDTINKQIKAMQLDSQPIDPTQSIDNQALIQKMDEKLKAFDQLSLSLVNSPWALLSFVLSGVLFAVAGAICLGIAFPILHAYWYRWLQAGPAISRINKQLKKGEEEYTKIEADWMEQRKLVAIQANELSLLPVIEQLSETISTLKTEVAKLMETCMKFDVDRRIYTYNDGYELGKTNGENMTDEEIEAMRNGRLRDLQDAKDSKPEKQPRVYRNNGLRPHQALRKAITDGFNEN